MPGHINLCVSIHRLVGVTMDTVSGIGDQLVAFGNFQIPRHHFRDELAKAYLWLPAQLGSRLARVTYEGVHFRWTKIAWIDGDDALATAIKRFFLGATAAPCEPHSQLLGCGIYE